ncbi:MAG: hypothetical protein QM296_13060 [Bacillota bacterium]|nr:hypothetical protein [Bacillota bacterium]
MSLKIRPERKFCSLFGFCCAIFTLWTAEAEPMTSKPVQSGNFAHFLAFAVQFLRSGQLKPVQRPQNLSRAEILLTLAPFRIRTLRLGDCILRGLQAAGYYNKPGT